MAPCSNGACKNNDTRACSRCKNAFYCGTACQKVAWLKHKDVCVKPGVSTASKVVEYVRSGTFNFTGLPRELRDRIYKELAVFHFSSEDRYKHARFSTPQGRPHIDIVEKDAAYEIERSVMISPGTFLGTSLIGRKIPCPRAKIIGLLLANKQISHELLEIAVSQNVFLVPVNETIELSSPGNIFRRQVDPALVSKVERLIINIYTGVYPFEDTYQSDVAKVKNSMVHIVKTLSEAGTRLKSLDVRYISCYSGEVNEIRHDADALMNNPSARNLQVMSACDGLLDEIDLADLQALYIHGTNIANALVALKVPVNHFSAHGDISGTDIKRMYDHFKTPYADESPTYRLDRWGQTMNQATINFMHMYTVTGSTYWLGLIAGVERRPCQSAKAERVWYETTTLNRVEPSTKVWRELQRRLILSPI